MGSGASSRSSSVGRPGPSQRLSAQDQRLKRWLGDNLWHPECAGMGLTELALQAVYSQERSQRIGNEPVVQALRELARYERALHEDYFEQQGVQSAQLGKSVNHRSMRYAKAAAIVRASAVRVTPDIRGGDLPFIGDVTAQQIGDIIRTGTCAALDCFRADVAVTDSRGRRRGDTVGAATRASFHALPAVGQKTAKQWWDLGCRSLEHVKFAAQPGGPLGEGGAFPISPEQRFSLGHRGDLLEPASAADIDEMLGWVQRGLEAVSGTDGWLVEVVGGGARSSARHDADFLVTHPSAPIEGVVLRLRDWLVESEHLFPPGQAMCRVQARLLLTRIGWLREEHLKEASAAPSMQTLDRFDHIYGIARLDSGKAQRMDIIICPHEEWAFALVGWIGSRTFLRFMRQHAKDCGMYLTSHRLLRKVDGSSLLVPDEAAPTDCSGRERWPPGWYPGRRVESQADVFALLGMPYKEPHERDA
ncbi:DNA polymerase lambda [Chlorella sorokiniana]|uniref:DNA polymerase lambda n=1 Tax=Chlorella sorokiniana TaxID=3076 RepID=A0A2P6TJH9_CHLSO|nr:DNA polymerase lambda [Chlorella sorokiniana]|eukprot:PRW44242.1 DNA polymerase lambda [Chlorella sorokiniana]